MNKDECLYVGTDKHNLIVAIESLRMLKSYNARTLDFEKTLKIMIQELDDEISYI